MHLSHQGPNVWSSLEHLTFLYRQLSWHVCRVPQSKRDEWFRVNTDQYSINIWAFTHLVVFICHHVARKSFGTCPYRCPKSPHEPHSNYPGLYHSAQKWEFYPNTFRDNGGQLYLVLTPCSIPKSGILCSFDTKTYKNCMYGGMPRKGTLTGLWQLVFPEYSSNHKAFLHCIICVQPTLPLVTSSSRKVGKCRTHWWGTAVSDWEWQQFSTPPTNSGTCQMPRH